MLRSFWSRLQSYRRLSSRTLGDLEKRAMEQVWVRGECTVRDLQESFGERLAYTTLMTTLDRLHKKGLLDRRREGKAFVYSARMSREEMEQTAMRDVIGALLEERKADPSPVVACFVDAITDEDESLLAQLEAEIRKRRAELANGSKE
jgi:predicted transcriptional regulator